MSKAKRMDRREFLRVMGLGLTAAVAAACQPTTQMMRGNRSTPVQGTRVVTRPPTRAAVSPTPVMTGTPTFVPDVEIALRAVEGEASILPDTVTRVWRFEAEVLSGPRDAVQPLPDTYLGPILHLRRGQRVRIRFTNDIPEETIVHWHGLHVPAAMDGHPRYVIRRGETYLYEFEVRNRAGTYWYHPHPHGRTGPQVYMGLAGLLFVTDDEEEALNLPEGEFDIPLVLQDRTFDSRGQFLYLPNGPMDRMMGFLGDTILVNGKPDYTLNVATRPYRFRILNGSNSRIYKLAWSDNTPLTVIGVDGGLLETPLQKPYVVLGPGERVDLWVDFSRYTVGTRLTLQSLPFVAPGGPMGGGMMGGGMMGGGMRGNTSSVSLPQGAPFPVLTVHVTQESRDTLSLPERLATVEPLPFGEAVNASTPRRIALTMTPMVGWTLNNRTFEMTAVAEDEVVRLNTIEVWEFSNVGGGMGMGMGMLPHPMHVHGEPFQVLRREVDPAFRAMWESVKDGYIDVGWKDTVVVMPGERVQILRRFADYTGLFLYHCHNLEHEDMGMMRNYEIRL